MKNEPRPEPGAECPKWLRKRAREIWHELAPGLARDGLLTTRSAFQLAIACDAMEKIEALSKLLSATAARKAAKASHYPQALSMLKAYWKTYQEASAKIGLSPADWGRLDVAPPRNDEDPAERFFGEASS